jgi:hypothetical protein
MGNPWVFTSRMGCTKKCRHHRLINQSSRRHRRKFPSSSRKCRFPPLKTEKRPKSTWVILDTTSINLAAKPCRTIRNPRHYTQLCPWPWPEGQYARGWTACASNHSRAQPEFPGSSACENPGPKGFSGVWCPWIIFEAIAHDHMGQESAPWYWLHPALLLPVSSFNAD